MGGFFIRNPMAIHRLCERKDWMVRWREAIPCFEKRVYCFTPIKQHHLPLAKCLGYLITSSGI